MSDIVKLLRNNSESYAPHLMIQAAEEIELLRVGVAQYIKERDEARRVVCSLYRAYAEQRGWDCFEEDGK